MENTITLSETDAQFAAVTEMINLYAQSVGLDPQKVYNPINKNWRWAKGSAGIEIFINRLDFGDGRTRDFIKIFSPVIDVPQTASLLAFYRRLLELNDEKLGVKLTIQKGTNKVWATFERDIKGMDAEELNTFIGDFEIWADHLDDLLKAEFPVMTN